MTLPRDTRLGRAGIRTRGFIGTLHGLQAPSVEEESPGGGPGKRRWAAGWKPVLGSQSKVPGPRPIRRPTARGRGIVDFVCTEDGDSFLRLSREYF